MNIRLVWVLSTAVIIPLVYVYASFLLWLVLGATFLPSDAIESFIVITAALRMAAILSIGRLRRADTLVIIDILSLEVLSLPFLALGYLFLGNPIFVIGIREVLFAWPFALILVSPIYGIYKLSTMMRDNASLTTILPSTVMLFALLAILDSATKLTPQASGLTGLSDSLISVFIGGLVPAVAPPAVALTGIVLYIALILYATTRGRDIRTSINPILILAVAGTLVALGWAFAALSITDVASLAFGVPGVALAAVLWVVSRAH
jgi:hypothetical protein